MDVIQRKRFLFNMVVLANGGASRQVAALRRTRNSANETLGRVLDNPYSESGQQLNLLNGWPLFSKRENRLIAKWLGDRFEFRRSTSCDTLHDCRAK